MKVRWVAHHDRGLSEYNATIEGHLEFTLEEGDYMKVQEIDPVLSTDSKERKDTPLFSGVINYFPLALAAVARVSKRGNDKHNPGQPLHHARGKSADHADCVARHLVDHQTLDVETGEYRDAAEMAWRALALLQELEEKRLDKPIARGATAPGEELPTSEAV